MGMPLTIATFFIFLSAAHRIEASNLSYDQTSDLLRAFEAENSLRLEQRHGVPLKEVLKWEQQELNWGLAQYLNSSAGGAVVEGAAVRDVRLTSDGLLLGLCHELGHLIRDRSRVISFGLQVELLTDYFATSDCFLSFLRNRPGLTSETERLSESNISNVLVSRCRIREENEAKLCIRGLEAIFSVTTFIGFARPLALQPDWSRVADSAADDFLQCTLESYLAGLFSDPLPLCFFKEHG